jgi:RNA polymerase sigma-70 factor (ECF subfamily)
MDIGTLSQAEFYRLYAFLFPTIYRVVYYITRCEESSKDICQDVFFRLYEKKMAFPNQEEVKYWLIRVAKNAALNHIKRRKREKVAYQRAFREIKQGQESIEYVLQKEIDRLEIRKVMKKLPANFYSVMILKEYNNLNYREIGHILNISEGAVKIRVFRAKKRLSIFLLKKEFAYIASG